MKETLPDAFIPGNVSLAIIGPLMSFTQLMPLSYAVRYADLTF